MFRFFDHPERLWLLLLLLPVLWFAWKGMRALAREKRWTRTALRLAVFTLLILALAGMRSERRSSHLTVIAVLDRSESVQRFGRPPEGSASWEEAFAKYLKEASKTGRKPDDRLGLIGFDGHAQLISAPRADLEGVGGGLAAAPQPTAGTNLQEALELAMASKTDPEASLRLVLAWDGRDTAGDMEAAVARAAAMRVPIDVLPVTYKVDRETMVESFSLPRVTRDGQRVPARVVLRSTQPCDGLLQVLENGHVLDLNGDAPGTGLAVQAGEWSGSPQTGEAAPYVLRRDLEMAIIAGGLHQYEAVFEPKAEANTVSSNDRSSAFTVASGEGRVLFVSGGTGPRAIEEARTLAAMLKGAGMEMEVVPSAACPQTLAEMMRYDALVFQDVPVEDCSGRAQEDLCRYVHDMGGGLLVLGGPNSFGAGGWTGTQVDRTILPVDCEIPADTLLPTGAIMFVIDCSGSMFAPVAGSPLNQMEIAIEAAVEAANTLFRQDLLGATAFDSSAHDILPLGPNKNPAETAKLLRSIEPGGGTDISQGMESAVNQLRKAKMGQGSLKHIIILSDFVDGGNGSDLLDELNKCNQSRISVSCCAIGDGANLHLAQNIAGACGGQSYVVSDPKTLPKIFLKEARTIRRNLIKEEVFTPVIKPSALPAVRGIGAVPQLGGLVITQKKQDARIEVPMLGPAGEPLLAWRQAGLGRCAAFTSDLSTRWSAQWLAWGGLRDFMVRLVRSVSKPPPSAEVNLEGEVRGGEVVFSLEAPVDAGVAQVQGGILRPDGTSAKLEMRQVAPGRFEARVPAPDAGNYVVDLQALNAKGEPVKRALGGVSRPPGVELRQLTSRKANVERVAQITGGRVLAWDKPAEGALFDRSKDKPIETVAHLPLERPLIIWAFVLLLLDIIAGRLSWSLEPVFALFRRMSHRPAMAGAAPGSMAALKAARGKVERGEATQVSAGVTGAKAAGAAPAVQPSAQSAAPSATPEAPPAAEAPGEPPSRLMAAKKRAGKKYD